MNKLGYGILSLVATENLAGYDINQIMKSFWQTTHSAIYPLLAELEQNHFLSHTLHRQEGKPDKKIYSITDNGLKVLNEWIITSTSKVTVKDEILLKMYCLKVLDDAHRNALLNELKERNKKRVAAYTASIAQIRQEISEVVEKKEAYFGRYLLIQKALNNAKQELKWCEWIRQLCDNDNLDTFYEQDFH